MESSVRSARAERTSSSEPVWGWRRGDALLTVLITVGAGVVRFAGLAHPGRIYFDEAYYAAEACLRVYSSPAVCHAQVGASTPHPPLAKLLIAVGIALFGYRPFGWRFASFLIGTATVPLVYVLAARLLQSRIAATLTAVLVAVDFLHFVHSRIAMLDVFAVFFVTVAFLCVVLERDAAREPARYRAPSDEPDGARATRFRRPWRWVAGAAAGAAAACKWEAIPLVVGILALVAVWEVERRRRQGFDRPAREALSRDGVSLVVSLVVVPVIVYTAAFAGTAHGSWLVWPWHRGSWLRAFAGEQKYFLEYHLSLRASHTYVSPAWSWPLLKRPVAYFFATTSGAYREVLAVGSPIVWWASLPALAYVGLTWIRRRGWDGPEPVIVTGFVFSYAPWFFLTFGRSVAFLFYLLPAVPFMCLALGYAAKALCRHRVGLAATGTFAAVALAFFVFFLPILSARALSPSAWRERILFRDCRTEASPYDRPHPLPSIGPGPSPSGWCWI